MLLVGTATGEVHLYDIASHQLLRTITPVKDKAQGLAITHIECMLKPPDLIGHISLGLDVGGVTNAKDVMPTKPVAPFQRVRDGKAREAHEVPMILPQQDEVRCFLVQVCLEVQSKNTFCCSPSLILPTTRPKNSSKTNHYSYHPQALRQTYRGQTVRRRKNMYDSPNSKVKYSVYVHNYRRRRVLTTRCGRPSDNVS